MGREKKTTLDRGEGAMGIWFTPRNPSIIDIHRAEVAEQDARRAELRKRYPHMRSCGIGMMVYDMWEPGMFCRRLLAEFG